MNKVTKTKVLIVGGGSAGMAAALNLEADDVILVEMPSSNSVLSPWNIMLKSKQELKEQMLSAGNNMNDLKLVNKFVEHHNDTVSDLESYGVVFRKSNLGVVPVYKKSGLEIKKILNKKIAAKGVKTIKGSVESFLTDTNGKMIGVSVCELGSKKHTHILFDFLILAGGGISSLYEFSTGEDLVNGTILALSYENGLTLKNMEFSMFHPFLVTDKRLPRVLMSGDILTKMNFTDDNGKSFLSENISHALRNNEHHWVFPQMVREFYKQSLKSKIFGELKCEHSWFENYKKVNEFGVVFKGFSVKKLGKIEIHPAFHSLIGGIMTNEFAQTSQKNVYAAGEICGGLHGSNRVGGTAVSEAWVFGKVAAWDINSKINAKVKESYPKDILMSGKLGMRKRIQNEVWKSLGPIKTKDVLSNFVIKLKEEPILTSEEKLFLAIAEISLLRKKTIGSFYREDLPVSKKEKNSYIKNNKIYFK